MRASGSQGTLDSPQAPSPGRRSEAHFPLGQYSSGRQGRAGRPVTLHLYLRESESPGTSRVQGDSLPVAQNPIWSPAAFSDLITLREGAHWSCWLFILPSPPLQFQLSLWPPLPIATAPSRPLGSGSFSSLLEPSPTHRGPFILSAVLGPRSG